ncbi:probable WRKY transcription factor 29 isoform X1 [Pyrus x bretschneideri]|uniref:probable WRKY transcription factor 29 isoform X1 n=1 Tax=Pyrus x bretschneideri TaxID=225117 RepID=UPI00202FC1B6|nr:probable WRKY transcription factor 29 isoform X1 [Pyrus x bretschneideri]
MENWDLQAVVRGCNSNIDEVIEDSQIPYFCAPLSFQEDNELFAAKFPQAFEATTTLDELEELYKPFYPVFQLTTPPTILTSSISVPQEIITQAPKLIKNMEESTPVRKRISRKNQNKRVVKEVKAEDLFSDVWAWRKYGQKPIKGSPYPRSYYRCSSSKGCSARKQVERSCSNPETFIITYTAEHNHIHPTRRNSLAGSTRSKFLSSKNKDKCGSSSNSPATPTIAASIEDDREFVESVSINAVKVEAKLSEQDEISKEIFLLDSTVNDENFPSFEDLDRKLEPVMDGWFSDEFSDNFPSPWFNIKGHSHTVTGAC